MLPPSSTCLHTCYKKQTFLLRDYLAFTPGPPSSIDKASHCNDYDVHKAVLALKNLVLDWNHVNFGSIFSPKNNFRCVCGIKKSLHYPHNSSLV